MPIRDANEFVEEVATGREKVVLAELPIPGGRTMHVKFVRNGRRRDRLLVFFATAAMLGRWSYPFLPTLRSPENQLTVCDPFFEEASRMERFPGFEKASVSGFCTRLGGSFVDLIEAVRKRVGVRRLVMAGSSSGGISALFHSHHFPHSVCVVANPIFDAPLRCRGFYREAYHHQLDAQFEEMADSPAVDVGRLYEKGFKNRVVILLNSMSLSDVLHTARFVGRVASPGRRENVLLKADFWGVYGHSGSVPVAELTRWVSVAFESPTVDLENIASAYLAGASSETSATKEMCDRIASFKREDAR